MRMTDKAIRAVERGEKTQHRVPIQHARTVRRPGPRGTTRVGESATYTSQPFTPTPGHSIVLQGATTREADVRILITEVEQHLLGDITLDQARAEGHKTIAHFADQWMRTHDSRWPPEDEALCKNCDGETTYIDHHGQTVPCEECDDIGIVMVAAPFDPDRALARFDLRHAHLMVWAITFELDADVTRFLNRRPHLPPTTSVTEALDPDAPLLGDPRPDWKERAEQRRREALKDRDGARLAGLRSNHERLAELQRLATERDVDIDKDLHYIGHRLDRIEEKVRRAPDRRAA